MCLGIEACKRNRALVIALQSTLWFLSGSIQRKFIIINDACVPLTVDAKNGIYKRQVKVAHLSK